MARGSGSAGGTEEGVNVGAAISIRLTGELDFRRTGELRSTILRASSGTAEVILNLSDVTFIDSAGLGVLIEARSTLAEQGIALKITNPPIRILTTLTIAGVAELFER